MLKIEEIINIEKSAKEEYKNNIIDKFEEEYPDTVEFLTKEITWAAQKRQSSVGIPFNNLINREKAFEYLIAKNFWCYKETFFIDKQEVRGISVYWE